MTRLTPEQRVVLYAIVRILKRRLRTGEPLTPAVTTVELTEATGRVGQVVGLICGNLTTAGLLRREGRARYVMTSLGLATVRDDLASQRRLREAFDAVAR